MSEDTHEREAIWRLRDLGGNAAMFVVSALLLLAGIQSIHTGWLMYFALGSAVSNIACIVWHLRKSKIALAERN